MRTVLTPAGAALLESCDRAVDGLEEQMLAELPVDQRAGLLAALRSCARGLGAGIHDE
jgi:hypothetical protein